MVKKNWNSKFKLVLTVKLRILINVFNAMLQIIVKQNLMEILMENAYAMMDTMMIKKINYASSALIFGI